MRSLPERLGSDPDHRATHLALLFAAASAVTLLGLVLPHQPQASDGGLAAVAGGAAVIAGLIYLGRGRLPGWAYWVTGAIGTALISLALFSNGEREGGAAGGDEVYYLWVALYFAYYFGRRVLVAQLAWIAVAYAAVLALVDPGSVAISRWLTLVGLIVGAAVVVRLLTERNERLLAELAEAARTDALTGLANRRAFEEQSRHELARAARTGRQLALLMADIDGFKQINDRFGHGAGDEWLAAVAATIEAEVRAGDTAARIGGDEFAVLLPETGRAAAAAMAGRLAAAVAARAEAPMPAISLTVGIATHPPHGPSFEALLRAADDSLYTAKRARSGEVLVEA